MKLPGFPLFLAVALAIVASAHPPALRASPRPASIAGATVQAVKFDPTTNQLTLRVANISHKDISAIGFTIFATYPKPDGGIVPLGWTIDLLGGIISYALDGQEVEPGAGHGIAAGRFRDLNVPIPMPALNYRAILNVVVYADSTADVLDEAAFQRIVMHRKGELLGMQKANELLASALVDPNGDHPSLIVAAKLKALVHALDINQHKNADDSASYVGLGFLDAIQNLENTPRDPAGRSVMEDDHLRAFIRSREDRISLLSSHTEVVERVQP
jgi:hypothetical protein